MKNSFLLVAISVLLISFSSCSDDVGNYHPKGKISRIYSDSGLGKSLREMWSWNENKLDKIEHSSWTEYFTYNKKGQIVRVDDYEYGEYTEYLYDGNKLRKIRYYDDNTLEEEYSVTYDGNYPSKIELTYCYYKAKGESRLKNEGTNPLKTLLSGNVYKTIQKEIEKCSSAYKSDGYNYTIKLEWEKGNISKIRYEEIEVGSDPTIEEVTLKYDNKNNPFHNCLSLYPDDYLEGYWGSKNNVIEEFWIDEGTTKYTYNYDGNYPIEKRSDYGYFEYYEYE